MTLEQKYTEQLTEMGIYRPAFDPAIKTLAMMERELRRVDKAWRDAGSSYTGDLFSVRVSLRKDILAHREQLGLTPKGYKRLRPECKSTAPVCDGLSAALNSLADSCREYDR